MKRMPKFAALLLAALLLFSALPIAADGEAQPLSVSLSLDRGEAYQEDLLLDGRADTYATIPAGATLSIDTPDAGTLVLRWYTLPEDVTIACYNGRSLLLEESASETVLNSVLLLPEGTTDVEVIAEGDDAALCDVLLYGKGDLPASVQQWEPTTNADVLIVVPYGGDEFRYFGGLIPALRQEGVSFNICYLGDYHRMRVEESLSALWALGVTTYPIFVSSDGNRSLEYKSLKRFWNSKAAQNGLADAIALVQPKVIVTCAKDEQDEAAAQLCYEFVEKAIKADRGETILKWYAHGGDTKLTYPEHILSFGERSALELSQSALDSFASLAIYHASVSENSSFALIQSEVGEDEECNSLLEHLDVSLNPLPTATPTPSPSPEPTEAPTPTPTEAAIAIESSSVETATPSPTAIPTVMPTPEPKGLFSCAAKPAEPVVTEAPTPTPTDTPTPSPSPTPTPTEVPTPEPTETPTPTPEPTATPAPTATPHPWAQYFRQEGEDAEVIVSDYDEGHWEYRSDNLSIIIERTETKVERRPLVYFTAHVRMKNNQYRSAIGDEGRTGRTSEAPWKIARRLRTVLLVTGDNMLNMDVDKKGILIRDGRVYQSRPRTEMLSWDPVNLSIGIELPDTVTVEEYQHRGVEEVISFGPWLIHEGETNPKLKYHSLQGLNPRTGIGMVEPGHFVVIVADGRQSDYSMGLLLEEFAELFEEEHCVEAYNLDGGVSAAMVFMGEQVNTHLDVKNKSQQRNLPDGLSWGFSEECPTLDDPITHNGIRKDGQLSLRGN